MAVTSSTCQEVWLRKVMKDLGQEKIKATKVYCDNKATISMTKKIVYHGRTKHIDIRAHFIRDLVAQKTIVL